MWFGTESLAQRKDDSRLADAGLARQLDDLSLAAGGEPPAIKQQRQLLLAPNKRSYVGCVPGLKATLGRDLGSDPKSSEGLGKTLEERCLDFLEVEGSRRRPLPHARCPDQ